MTRAGGHGGASAKGGTGHWWAQRVTAVALVPLSLWFVAAMVSLTGADHGTVTAWLARPSTTILMVLTLAVTFYHGLLGLEVVIDDYVHAPGARLAALLLVRFACVVVGLAGVFAVLRIAFSA